MPQQLIYTSAPRGVVAGRSGHCTVARSAAMREALMLQLEKWSYYQHLSLSGGQERPIHSCRVIDLRGSRYHVLTRIQDAGLDFTGRTNFLAHHLVFTPEEIRQFPSPPIILRDWTGWVKSWSKEPVLLENEDWSALTKLSASVSVPAKDWQQLTGDAGNGYGLLESRAGIAFRVDNLTEDRILGLFAEGLELLELRDPRRDFRATAWQFTFTTSMQEQDNPADFRWRCLHSDNPASNRFAGPDCRQLSDVRAARVTSEETMFARAGRQPPRFVIQPQNVRSTEGETAKLHAKAEGVPSPSYQWFTVDRAGNGQIIASGTDAELSVQNPPLGLSRYVVRASNSQGDVTSEVVTLSVEQKLRLSQSRTVSDVQSVARSTAPSYVRSADDIDRQRRRIEAEKAQEHFQNKLRRRKILTICGVIVGLAVLGIAVWLKRPQHPIKGNGIGVTSSNETPATANTPIATPADATGAVNTAKTQLKAPEAADTSPTPATKTERTITTPAATEFKLPDGWIRVAIGNVSNPNAEFISPRYDLSGSAEGFAAQGDNLLFVCKSNFTKAFQATLIRNETPPAGSVCGVMARESDKTNSAFLFIGATPSKIIAHRRDAAGKFDSAEHDIPKANQAKQIFFRVQADEKQILPLYSFDAKTWQAGGLSNAVSKTAPMMVGFAISSGNSSTKVVAKFGGVSEQ